MRCLVTGAGGFVGSEVVRTILDSTEWDVIAADSFRWRGITDRLTAEVDGRRAYSDIGARLDIVVHDMAVPVSPQLADRIGEVDVILALASGSHVDASLKDPRVFCENNTGVALSTLEYARTARPRHLVWVSTDEVYGDVAEDGLPHREWDPPVPSNPYSASKAAQEAFALGWWRSFGVPVSIVNMQNVYGPAQGAEKFIPRVIGLVRDGKTVQVHGTAGADGSRCWLYVGDVAEAILQVAEMVPASFAGGAARPERWNIAGTEKSPTSGLPSGSPTPWGAS